jgi:hypothetical protein
MPNGLRSAKYLLRAPVPSALPWIFNGMRLAVRYAFAAVIVGELMAANKGIGFLIEHYAGNFNATSVRRHRGAGGVLDSDAGGAGPGGEPAGALIATSAEIKRHRMWRFISCWWVLNAIEHAPAV